MAPNIPIIRTGRTAGGAICSRYRRNVEKRFALIFADGVRVRVPYGVFHEDPDRKQQTLEFETRSLLRSKVIRENCTTPYKVRVTIPSPAVDMETAR